MIGQYSLIEDCDNISVKKTVLAWLSQYLLDECYEFISHHPLEMDPVKLEDTVKEGSLVKETNDYKVATALSRYCAYLVVFLPEFLPEHSLTTTKVFQRVLGEAKKLFDTIELERGFELGELPRKESIKFTRIQVLEPLLEGADLNTVKKGVKLASQLLKMKEASRELRWKVMADFWAETMVYIAPSDKVAAHIDQLAKGGEFVTLIWALLSNAGIHERTHGGCESTASPDDRNHKEPRKDTAASTSGEH